MIVLKSIDNIWKIVYKMSSGIADMMEWTSEARQWIRWRLGQCVCVAYILQSWCGFLLKRSHSKNSVHLSIKALFYALVVFLKKLV